ncbi:MAG: cupin domain-containing protein [Bdellovibrionales bacterium]|nr:cupin domain-containing protein [Bdellovibrionales bacterium]
MFEQRVNQLIRDLDLAPHPEGGYYSEYYRSSQQISASIGPRACSTAIYFLLAREEVSKFHRLNSDEIWHFYEGTSLYLHTLGDDGLDLTVLGEGGFPNAVVPAGTWIAAEVPQPEGYALVGCTVSPGFEFEDFELAERAALLREFPDYGNIIEKLT